MQSGLSQPSPVVLSGTALHNFPAVQHQELAKAQSSLAFQQTSNTQPIPILYEHQLGQASGLGGSQLIDTHILQVGKAPHQTFCCGLVQDIKSGSAWVAGNLKKHLEENVLLIH